MMMVNASATRPPSAAAALQHGLQMPAGDPGLALPSGNLISEDGVPIVLIILR
eukprot:CAMPEP_0115465750 /NCGR_PEP_ID=MMETSP0271-20121206/49561_1 /TAXON_ID=71861 /ORGANISM="Scrippsiella trochoidea, Strain CCMP3099" /LENGTH=52 /DNA_ID=CAMNT_0002892699 /DNA_START=387 /DNA_END=541 /DNA_ORIENTATION=-